MGTITASDPTIIPQEEGQEMYWTGPGGAIGYARSRPGTAYFAGIAVEWDPIEGEMLGQSSKTDETPANAG